MEERNEAIQAAQQRRQVEKGRRLVAHLDPTEPARLPTPVAEKPELSPYDKFGGGR